MRAATRGAGAGRLVAAAALAVAAIAWWGLRVDVAAVLARLPTGPGLTVSASDAWIALRPWPTVLAHTVQVDADGVQGRAARARVTVALGALLRGHLVPRRLAVRDTTVRMRAEPGLGPVRCGGGWARAEPDGHRQWWIEGRTGCRWGGAAVSGLGLAGRVRWTDGGRMRLRGRLTGRTLVLGDVRAGRFEAALRAGRDGVRIRDGRLALGGGEVTGRARYLLSRGRRRGALDVRGAGRTRGDAPRTEPFVHGRWTMALRGRAVAATGRPLRRHLAGHARMVVLDGALGPLDVGAALLDGLDVWRGRRRRRLRQRFADVFGGDALAFDRAVAVARADDGRIDLYPLRARSRSYRAVGWARIGRRGGVTGQVDIVPETALADAMLGHGALRAIVGGGADAELRVPLVVTGRLDDLRVRPAPEFTRGVIERALGGTVLGDVLDRLLDR